MLNLVIVVVALLLGGYLALSERLAPTRPQTASAAVGNLRGSDGDVPARFRSRLASRVRYVQRHGRQRPLYPEVMEREGRDDACAIEKFPFSAPERRRLLHGIAVG